MGRAKGGEKKNVQSLLKQVGVKTVVPDCDGKIKEVTGLSRLLDIPLKSMKIIKLGFESKLLLIVFRGRGSRKSLPHRKHIVNVAAIVFKLWKHC